MNASRAPAFLRSIVLPTFIASEKCPALFGSFPTDMESSLCAALFGYETLMTTRYPEQTKAIWKSVRASRTHSGAESWLGDQLGKSPPTRQDLRRIMKVMNEVRCRVFADIQSKRQLVQQRSTGALLEVLERSFYDDEVARTPWEYETFTLSLLKCCEWIAGTQGPSVVLKHYVEMLLELTDRNNGRLSTALYVSPSDPPQNIEELWGHISHGMLQVGMKLCEKLDDDYGRQRFCEMAGKQ